MAEKDPGKQTADTAGQTDGNADDAKKVDAGKAEKTFNQADVDRIVADRLKRADEQAAKKAEAAARKAKEEALVKNQEFQELAQQRLETITEQEAELAKLADFERAFKKAEAALVVYRDQLIEHVPDNVKPLLEKMDTVDQLEWLAQNVQAGDDGKQDNGDKPRFPNTPKPGQGTMSEDDRRKQAWKPRL